jgi:hypothetical protein
LGKVSGPICEYSRFAETVGGDWFGQNCRSGLGVVYAIISAELRSDNPKEQRGYVANQPNVPVAHFSVLTEMTQLLIAPMEIMGYTLPEHMLPDISHGKMFCKWLRDVHGIDTDGLPTYLHVFEDGRRVWPKAYPDELLADFRKHFRNEWLPNRAIEYFRGRDSEALQFLPKLIAANKPKKLN